MHTAETIAKELAGTAVGGDPRARRGQGRVRPPARPLSGRVRRGRNCARFTGCATCAGFTGGPEETGAVLDDVRSWLSRYIATMTPADLDLLTLWAAHTACRRDLHDPRLVRLPGARLGEDHDVGAPAPAVHRASSGRIPVLARAAGPDARTAYARSSSTRPTAPLTRRRKASGNCWPSSTAGTSGAALARCWCPARRASGTCARCRRSPRS